MSEVTLSKALNVKTKLAGRVSHIGNLISNLNSTRSDVKQNFDVKVLFAEYEAKTLQLGQVKAVIAKANASAGIFDIIYEMAELKSKISFLRSLNTREGEESVPYSNPPKSINYVAFLNDATVESMALDLETKIEDLQDKITYLNQTTKVTLPD